METLEIKYAAAFSMDQIRSALAQHFRVASNASGGLVVEKNGSRIYINVGESNDAADPCLLWADYNDVSLAKAVLRVIADDSQLVVDLDFDVPPTKNAIGIRYLSATITRLPIEIKAGVTVASDAFKTIDKYIALSGDAGGILVNGADANYARGTHTVRGWAHVS